MKWRFIMHSKKMIVQLVRVSLMAFSTFLGLSAVSGTAFAAFGASLFDAPEIDGGSIATGLALVGFGASLLAGRFRKK